MSDIENISHLLLPNLVSGPDSLLSATSSTATSIIATSPPPTRIVSDTLSPHHARTPSQHHTLHHSASLHTGLRQGGQDSPLRRPSMPILNAQYENKDKGKGKARFRWDITSLGSGNEELKSPTTAGSVWFSSKGKEREVKELMSPGGSTSQPTSAGGSIGRSGSMLLSRGLLRKKESNDITREEGKANEGDKETKKGQRPQLRVATSSTGSPPSSAAAESSRSPEHIKSPTVGHRRFVRKMRSDASILSTTRGGDEVPPSPQPQSKKSRVVKILESVATTSIEFAEGK